MTLRFSILAVVSFCVGCGADPRAGLLPGENYSRREALSGIEQGKPIVVAILRFEADTGCWPHDPSELVPEYLSADDFKTWRYHTFGHDDFALVYLGPLAGGTLHYDHSVGKPDSWNVWWEDPNERQNIDIVDVAQPKPPASAFTPDQRANKRLDLIHRRIKEEPHQISHRVGLMRHYFELGEFELARIVCEACVEKWPDDWWSYLMLAKIEGRLADQSNSERRLKELAGRWDDFFGHAFLGQFYFDRNDFVKCKASLGQAVKRTPTCLKKFDGVESWVDECYYHNAAYMGDRTLCLAICDRWKEFVRDVQGYGGVEERVLRIVCAMNEADWDKATEILQAIKEPPTYAKWQDEGIQTLEREVREKNARYEHDPNLFCPAGRGCVPLAVEFNYK